MVRHSRAVVSGLLCAAVGVALVVVGLSILFGRASVDIDFPSPGEGPPANCSSAWESWRGHIGLEAHNVVLHDRCDSARHGRTAAGLALTAVGAVAAVGAMFLYRSLSGLPQERAESTGPDTEERYETTAVVKR